MAGAPAAVGWSQPVRLFDASRAKESLSMIPARPGVYRVRVLNAKQQPVVLRRLDGDDPDGILHIGMTGKGGGNLRSRITNFQQTALRGKGPSQSGWVFNYYRYERRFSLDSLYVDYVVAASAQAARKLEHQLHEEYWLRFLDLPSLDAQA